MSYIMQWDTADIIQQLHSCSAQVNSPYNDGWTSLICKKDLLKIKYELDDILRQCQTFGESEQRIIEELEKERTWKILDGKM